ncbi:unnamed protein product, partial [Medioppia subpectinata]
MLRWKLIEAKKLSFKKCIQSIYGTLLEMMSTPFWRQRPECREVLAKHNDRHKVMTGNEYRIDYITDTDVEREVRSAPPPSHQLMGSDLM